MPNPLMKPASMDALSAKLVDRIRQVVQETVAEVREVEIESSPKKNYIRFTPSTLCDSATEDDLTVPIAKADAADGMPQFSDTEKEPEVVHLDDLPDTLNSAPKQIEESTVQRVEFTPSTVQQLPRSSTAETRQSRQSRQTTMSGGIFESVSYMHSPSHQHTQESGSHGTPQTSEAVLVRHIYKECGGVGNDGVVTVERLLESIDNSGIDHTDFSPEFQERLTQAIVSLNLSMGKRHKGPANCMCMETIRNFLLADFGDLAAECGADATNLIMEVRELCVAMHMNSTIEQICKTDELTTSKHSWRRNRCRRLKKCIERGLEPFVITVIICNALTIGISLDNSPGWDGWIVLESVYTSFFVGELFVKLVLYGIPEHFLGRDWFWNWIDFFIVCFAVGDFAVTIVSPDGIDSSLASLSVIRLVRLIRVTRLVRLMKLKAFTELALMINGIVGGMKTLFWAVAFLLIVVYVFGVLLRQVMNPEHSQFNCQDYLDDDDLQCPRGARELEKYGPLMFSNTIRSMLTVFNCFTDGCTSPGGTPLIWHLYDTHGTSIVIAYILAYVFVTFGICNLILAIFVENTLAYAHSSEEKRAAMKQRDDNHKHAIQLQKLLITICRIADDSGTNAQVAGKPLYGLRKHLSKHTGGQQTETLPPSHLSLHVDRKSFEEALSLEVVQRALEKLDVSFFTCGNLFEVLDADGNGYLAVSELADGIMRLRGPAHKADIISTVLMLRSMQKNMKNLQDTVTRNQRLIKELIGKNAKGTRSSNSSEVSRGQEGGQAADKKFL